MHKLHVTIESYLSSGELESLKKTATSLSDNVLVLDKNIVMINRGIVIKDYVEYIDVVVHVNIEYETIIDVLDVIAVKGFSTILKRARRIIIDNFR
jgi:hypothetical protein